MVSVTMRPIKKNLIKSAGEQAKLILFFPTHPVVLTHFLCVAHCSDYFPLDSQDIPPDIDVIQQAARFICF